MTPTQYREALSRLGLTQLDAALIFDISLRASQGYALGDYRVPRAIAIVLQALLDRKPLRLETLRNNP